MRWRNELSSESTATDRTTCAGGSVVSGKFVLATLGVLAITLMLQSSLLFTPRAEAQAACTKYAAVSGSDRAAGTKTTPFRTAQKLVDSLNAGQVGCLHAGTYTEGDKTLKITQNGIEIRSASKKRATIRARIHVAKGANGVTVRRLKLDGSPNKLPSPTINANNTRWIGNNVTNRHKSESCFMVGDSHYGVAIGTVIRNNRIHNCGRLPRTNHDHGIYLKVARDTKILNNKIYDNADRGIQLRYDAQRTLIRKNVIDGNGQGIIFSGDRGIASNNNVIRYNLITNSRSRHNVESWYPQNNPLGKGNLVNNNCVRGGARDSGNGGIQKPQRGFSAKNNIIRYPMYVNRKAKDFRLRRDSPCRSILR